MQFEYFGLDKKAEKINLFPEFEAQIKLPLNYQENPFNGPKSKIIQAMDLFKFRNVFVSSEGIIFKNFSFSEESIFYGDVKKLYTKLIDKFHFFRKNYLKRKTIHLKKAVLALDPWSQINYYHWLCDAMMRVAAVSPSLEKDMMFIVPYEKFSLKNEVILESLRAFNIDESQILKIEKNQKVKVDELLMPSHATQDPSYFREDLLNLVREKIKIFHRDNLEFNLGKKIYISREKALYRKVRNENEVINLLKKHDFKIVNMEDYSFLEQVAISHNANCLVSCHGAGLANILFMERNSFVLELINENIDRMHFYNLASSAAVNYLLLKCRQVSDEKNANDDIVVDIAALEKNLEIINQI